jgi:sugar phosphate isomerase/epimerase
MGGGRPRFSVCEFTTPTTSFEQDLELYAGVAAGIGVCEEKLRPGEEAEQARALRASGLRATVCIPRNISPLPCEPVYPGPAEIDARVELMLGSLRRLAALDPEVVVLVTGDDLSLPRQEARRIAVEGLREAARLALDLGFEIGLEPIRPDIDLHISIPWTLPETVDFVEEIGVPGVGITFDVYNLFRTENVIADAERYAPLVNSVHVNDWTEPPRGNGDRTFPGEGAIELAEMIAALERGGFRGCYDLEIFASDGLEHDGADALWRLPPAEILSRGRAGFDRVWEEAVTLGAGSCDDG